MGEDRSQGFQTTQPMLYSLAASRPRPPTSHAMKLDVKSNTDYAPANAHRVPMVPCAQYSGSFPTLMPATNTVFLKDLTIDEDKALSLVYL